LSDGVIAGAQAQDDFERLDSVFSNPLEVLDEDQRVWLVTTTNVYQQADRNVEDYLNKNARLTHTWQAEGVLVRLYELH
jgi:hypothetical protein